MPVPLNPPLVTDAVPSKTYDQWFFTNFQATNLTPTTGELLFTKVPQVAATGELLLSGAVNVCVPFWAAVAALPEAAAAMTAVLAALPAIEEWSHE